MQRPTNASKIAREIGVPTVVGYISEIQQLLKTPDIWKGGRGGGGIGGGRGDWGGGGGPNRCYYTRRHTGVPPGESARVEEELATGGKDAIGTG